MNGTYPVLNVGEKLIAVRNGKVMAMLRILMDRNKLRYYLIMFLEKLEQVMMIIKN